MHSIVYQRIQRVSPMIDQLTANSSSGKYGHLCLFAHFDMHDRVDPYVKRYISAIAGCGFDVVFISASRLSEKEIAPMRQYCVDVILRENSGHDFGSWSEGYRRYRGEITGDLLLANDSVYGPIGDLRQALRRLRSFDADFCGMVASLERKPHLQSWFLLANQRTHMSEAFASVLLQDFRGRPKQEIIEAGEIAMSEALMRAGFKISALFTPAGLCVGRAFNPTHFLWRELIEQAGIPFIKVELLRDNPCRISELQDWRRIVAARAPDLSKMIEAHLCRLGCADRADDDLLHAVRCDPLNSEAWLRRAFRLRTAWYPFRIFNGFAYMLCGVVSLWLRFRRTIRQVGSIGSGRADGSRKRIGEIDR